MSRSWFQLVVLSAAALVALPGCSPYTRMPNLYNPGPAVVQRNEAVRYDPYPLDDVAPEIVGGRPLSYQRPLSETTRGQLFAPPPARLTYPAQSW